MRLEEKREKRWEREKKPAISTGWEGHVHERMETGEQV